MSAIRITKIPPGFASQKIRQAWVGVEISLPTNEELIKESAAKINIIRRAKGEYLVYASEAIDCLRRLGKEEAADFWSSLNLGRYIVFSQTVCELLP